MAILSLVFGVLGNIISIGLFLSPVPTFRRVLKQRSPEDFKFLPYAITLTNCLLWTWYGLPWVKMNIPVLTINILGAFLQITYIYIFFHYATSAKRLRIILALVCITILEAVVIVVTIWVMPKNKRKLFSGILCVIFTIGMNIAPLSIMRLVIATRSVEYMPFYLSVFVFANGCAWLVYGLLTSDIFIIIPNALGALLGVTQLVLYAIYSRATPKVAQEGKPQKEGKPQNIEMLNPENQGGKPVSNSVENMV